MKIYFVQHGIALSKEIDPQRPLSDKGRSEISKVAVFLKGKALGIERVYHSGKLRATQTAEILANELDIDRICEIEGMNPNDEVKEFADGIDATQTLYVGHLPHLQRIVSYLLAGDENSKVVKFINGALVCLEKTENQYELLWYITPELV